MVLQVFKVWNRRKTPISGKRNGGPEVDRGWAWVVMVADFLGFFILIGQAFSISVYFVEFLEVFGESRSVTAWIGSLGLGVIQIGGLTHGFFITHLGARGLTVLGSLLSAFGLLVSSFATSVLSLMFYYGILTSFGFSLCYCGLVGAVSRHFRRHLFWVMGFCIAGGGVGVMVFPYMLTCLIEEYGWRGSLLLQSGISLQLVVLGTLFFPVRAGSTAVRPDDDAAATATVEEVKVMTWRRRVVEPRLMLFIFSVFLQGLGLFTLYVIYKDFAMYRHLESVYPVTMVALGVGNILGRFLTGVITSHVPPLLYHAAVCAGSAVVMFGIYYGSDRPELFVVLGSLFGYGHGSAQTLLVLVVAELFGRQEVAATFGYVFFYSGLGTLIGAPLSGFLFDRSGSYFGCFLLSGIVVLISMCSLLALFLINKWKICRTAEGEQVSDKTNT